MVLYFDDTHFEIEKIIIEELRKWPAWKKLAQVDARGSNSGKNGHRRIKKEVS